MRIIDVISVRLNVKNRQVVQLCYIFLLCPRDLRSIRLETRHCKTMIAMLKKDSVFALAILLYTG